MEKIVEINTEYISLSNLLKLSGVIGTGGQAKLIIQDGLVDLNGAPCTKRGKKVYPGDEVKLNLDPEVKITVRQEPKK